MGPPVVGYMGRFVEEKGIGALMRALDRVATPWRALFMGGGPMEGVATMGGALWRSRAHH